MKQSLAQWFARATRGGGRYGFAWPALLGGLSVLLLPGGALAAGPATKLAFTVQPSNTVAGALIAPAVQVTVQDATGATVTTATNSITIAIDNNPAGGTLSGTGTVSAVAGVATFSNLSINKAGNGYSLRASATGLTGATSNAFNITPGVASKLGFTVPPSDTVAGATITPAVRVAIQDAYGNTVNSKSWIKVAIGNNPGGGTLSGTKRVKASAGVATFSTLSINNPGTGYTLTATCGALTKATSAAFNIASTATKLAFTVPPSTTAAGATIAPAIRVAVQDAGGRTVPTATNSITLVIGNNPGGGTLAGTTTVSAVAGVATFSNLSINNPGTAYTLAASATGLTGKTSAAFNITGPPSQLAFTVAPANSVAGATLAPAVQVAVQDAGGRTVPTATNSITLAIGANPGGGTLAGTTTVSAVAGVATFNNLSLDKAGTGYTLTAAAAPLTGATSSAFAIAPAAASQLAFGVPPADTVAGATLSPAVTVRALDAFGNLTSATPSVTLTLNPGTVTLFGTTTVNAAAGVATFGTLSIEQAAAGYTLTATAPGLTNATSGAFAITPAAASQLAFTTPPADTVVGVTIAPPVAVTVQDAFGNQVTSASDSITVAIGSNPGGSTLAGTVTAAAVNGVATFANLSLDRTGLGYTLAASASGLTGATSAAFNITTKKLAFTVQPANTVAGVALAPAVVVTVQDALGNTVTAATDSITLALGANPGGGTLGGTLTASAVAGIATFSNLSVNKTGTGYTLTAHAPGVAGATSAAFNITPGAATQLAFAVPPADAAAGAALAPAVQVAELDAYGNLTGATDNLTVAIGTNPGGATLSGTTTVAAVNGVATFGNLSLDKTGAGYTLTASATGLASATSGTFNVTPGAATQLVFAQQPATAAAGATLAAVAVRELDAYGNLTAVADQIQLTLNVMGVTLFGTNPVAAVNGVATFGDLRVQTVGTGYTLTATAGALTPATSNAFDITAGAAAQLAFTGQPSDAVAGVAVSPAVVVTVVDAYGNPVASATDTITVAIGDNPGGATLSGTKTVAAVAGVAAFGNLSLDKAGIAYTLTATAGALTGATSGTFDVTAGTATHLAFTVQPSNALANQTIAPAVQVTELDAYGNPATAATDNITLAIGTNPPGNGVLSGTKTIAAVNGVATFSNLSINKTGNGYTLTASASGKTGATSAAFNITVNKLAFTTPPSTAVAGVTLSPAVTVTVQDSGGSTITTATDSITLALGANPGGATLVGTLTVSAVAGVATFNSLSLDKTGTGYTLTASATNLAGATSATFNITPGTANQLAFTLEPGTTPAGTTLSAVAVTVADVYGNAVTTATDSVTLALGANPGGSTLAGTTTVSAVAGVATFVDLSLDKTGTGYTLAATAGTLTAATSTAFDITPGAASHLTFAQPPGATSAGATMAPVAVAIADGNGNRVTGASTSVTLALGANPGGATLSGTRTVAAVNGVATFSTLSLDKAGTGYTLAASATGLTGVTSSTFDVTAGMAHHLAFATPPGNTAGGATLTPAVTVTVADAHENTVTTASDSIAVALGANPGGGTLSGTSTVAAVNGVATFSTLSLDKAGTGYTLTASATGLTGATSAAFNVTVGPAHQLAFTTPPVGTTAGALLASVAVTVQDAGGNTVTSAGHSVTLTLAGAGTLSGTNPVGAANGVATFSNLSIAPAGTGYTLTASAGALTAATSDPFDITPAPNHPPTIVSAAWADTNPVIWPAGTTVHVVANDPDGDPLGYAWSKVSGAGTVTFAAPAAADSGVTFSATGYYVLRVTVSDGKGGSVTSDVSVTASSGSDPRADVNHDGVVNALDLQIVIRNFGMAVVDPGCDARADANADGVVNALDLQIVIRNFGMSVP